MKQGKAGLRRIVIDTNILVSGVVFGGKPQEIIKLTSEGSIKAYTSEVLLVELMRTLRVKFEFDQFKLHETEASIRDTLQIVWPKHIPLAVERDPDDNHVLAVAVEVKADVVVTGDKDLLSLGEYKKIPILSASEFLVECT